MIHEGKVFNPEQCTNLYFGCVEVINDLVESFQAYSTLIMNQPELAGEYSSKQREQASYYKKVFRNIDVVLQMDQVHCIHKGQPQLPSPRYVPSRSEMEYENLQVILQLAYSDVDMTDKETQIIHRGLIKERDCKLINSDSNPRL